MSKFIEILRKESPFFISDICKKYGYSYHSIYRYIRWHHEMFIEKDVKNGTVGRPKKLYTVKKIEI